VNYFSGASAPWIVKTRPHPDSFSTDPKHHPGYHKNFEITGIDAW
jgi:hypothetical protein